MYNWDNVHDIDLFPGEKAMKRSEPTNQAKTKTNIAKDLKTSEWFKKLSYHLSSV